MILLLFPINIFKINYLNNIINKNNNNKNIQIFLIEEPIFFGFRSHKMNFNKIKLVLHRASMKYYENYLSKYFSNIIYIPFNHKDINSYDFLPNNKDIHIFDPTDYELSNKLTKISKKLSSNLIVNETPNFICSKSQLAKYMENNNKKQKFFHKNFYEWQKKELKLLEDEKSYDKENRKALPKNIYIPPLPKNDNDSKYVIDAKKYVNDNFKNNYGDVDNFIFPISFETSEKWFDNFLINRFNNFGTYEDAIDQNNNFIFHSIISPMLNIGLLQSTEIIEKASKYFHQNKIEINNYEAFIRQIIGWREYSRFLYLYAYNEMTSSNFFNHNNSLNHKWYNGTTNILPVDNAIKNAFKYGYIHHILRLMVICNIMNLCHIQPFQVYKWFMEFSADSYDWVMINNVYSMGLFADGGLTMKKPYFSSDNYIMKMSNYKKGEWNQKWKDLYYYFLYFHKNELKKTAISRNLNLWEKLSKKEKNRIIYNANSIIKELCI
jgi:deoxyribodipyrimidine photolyase-related protein